MAALGTWTWLERTGGKLSRTDRLRLIAQGVRARATARLSGRRLHAVRHVDLDSVTPPDSAIARVAEALCRDVSEPWLYHHSLRAWYWGRLLDDGSRRFDLEAVYVAMLLHDLGLTDRYRLRRGSVQCFTEPGAREAGKLARAHGWPDARAELTANAIALHLNIIVGNEHGREAQIVRSGAGADIIGQNLSRIEVDQQDAVLRRHPRLQFKQEIDRVMRVEVAERPCCRMAFLYQTLHFDSLVARAPFAE